MVNPKTVPEKLLHLFPIRALKISILKNFRNSGFLFFRTKVPTHQILRRASTGQLREMNEINRSFIRTNQLFDLILKRGCAVRKLQGHRTLFRFH